MVVGVGWKVTVEVLQTLFDMSFWREFIDIDICKEARMMHEVSLKKE